MFLLFFLSILSFLSAEEFTISSYNAGGLKNHYDYLRAVTMEKLIQERYREEPETMALNERIQAVALKILFSNDPIEQSLAQQEWDQKNYSNIFNKLTQSPTEPGSPNKLWFEKSNLMITDYQTFPPIIFDKEISNKLANHIELYTKEEEGDFFHLLEKTRSVMAKNIFTYSLNQDIICLQETNYLNMDLFAEHYEGAFSTSSHSVNEILWNKNRFSLIKSLGEVKNRALAVKLYDQKTGKTLLVASAHISGCNPYQVQTNPITGEPDSQKGDRELQAVIQLFEEEESDLKLIGMDSNVTALHPRLHIAKNSGYQLDSHQYLEPTCSSPNQIMNTRIDWIFLKSNSPAHIVNIPIVSVGLNSMLTNVSDHKPIAAKVVFSPTAK